MARRWLLIALFVSLALNVFIVGGLVGASLNGVRLRPPPPASGPGRGGGGPMQAIRVLPPERQEAWRAGNPDFGRTFGPKMREARRATHDAMLRVGEDPMPRDAILASLRQARTLEVENRLAMDQRLVDFAATLTPAERKQFAEALARPPRDLRRRGPGGDGRGDRFGRPGRPLPDRQ